MKAIATIMKAAVLGLLSGSLNQVIAQTPAPRSTWVYQSAGGRLDYRHTKRGDRIMDFSAAGYMGGGVSLPDVKAIAIVYPMQGDNTASIQRTIDSVARLPLVNSFRGAVLLAPGMFTCNGELHLDSSGVVLRGSGPATKIVMSGAPHPCFSIGGPSTVERVGEAVSVTDAYIPSGADAFTVADAGELSAGDEIAIIKPVTPKWVHYMNMDVLVRDGKPQTWIKGELVTERTIEKIEGNRVSVSVPLTDSYDEMYTQPGIVIQRIERRRERSQIGLEDLSIIAPAQSVTINQQHYAAIRTRGLADAWIRNIEILNTVNSIAISGRRITVDRVQIRHTVPTIGAAKPADLAANGAQLFFNKCTIRGDNVFYLATGAKVSGPIVLLNCRFNGKGWIQPHQRWATGLLIDGCTVADGGIDFMNRGEMGSGHGWAIGWAVAWNCIAKSYLNQQPPGAYNWVIGSKGEKVKKAMPFDKNPFLPEGTYDVHGKAVRPRSLYLAQLKDRLGEKALYNIGYSINKLF